MSNELATKPDPGEDRFRIVHRCLSVFLLVFIAVSLGGLPRLRFDDDLKNLFRGDTREFRDFEKYSELFGSQESNCSILLTCRDVLSVANLKRIRSIDTRLHSIENVAEINSLCHLLSRRRVGRVFLPVLPFEGAADNAWEKAAQELLSHPLGTGLLYSEDRRCALIVFGFKTGISTGKQSETVLEIRQLLDDHWLGPTEVNEDFRQSEFAYGLTGMPLIRQEVLSNLMRDQQKFTWLGLAFSLVIGWCLFRKPLPVFFVALVPFVGLGCIMGWLGWLGISLNIVNNVITPLVLVIGFAEVIHILFLTGGFLGQGIPAHLAVVRTIRQLLVPCLLAALTTAIGFGSLYLSSDKSLREFAIVASLASLVMFGMVLATSSCLLSTPLARFCVRDSRKPSGSDSVKPIYRSSLNAVVVIVVSSLAMLLISCNLALRNHTDFRFTENLPEFNPAVETLRKIDRSFGGSSADQIIVEFEKKPTPQFLIETLRRVRKSVHDVPGVGNSVSFLELLDSLPPEGGTDLQHFQELKLLPRESWDRFLRLNPTVTKIQLKLPDIGSHRLFPVIKTVEDSLLTIESDGGGVATTLTGLNILSVNRSQQMIGDLTSSLIGASLAIFLLILVTYRSLLFSLAAIIVNAIPILGVAAIMFLCGQSIQYTGIMLLCVCLGLAVDDTVHFLSKLSFELKLGIDFETAVYQTIKKLWPVFMTTSVMLGVGFGLAATSDIPTFQTFGGFACVALLLALVADLVVLPALLILMHRVFGWK